MCTGHGTQRCKTTRSGYKVLQSLVGPGAISAQGIAACEGERDLPFFHGYRSGTGIAGKVCPSFSASAFAASCVENSRLDLLQT